MLQFQTAHAAPPRQTWSSLQGLAMPPKSLPLATDVPTSLMLGPRDPPINAIVWALTLLATPPQSLHRMFQLTPAPAVVSTSMAELLAIAAFRLHHS